MKKRIPLKISLLLLAFAPFFAFTLSSANQFYTSVIDRKITRNQMKNIVFLDKSSDLLYHLQQESGYSAAHIDSGIFDNQLAAARKNVDSQIAYINENFKSILADKKNRNCSAVFPIR